MAKVKEAYQNLTGIDIVRQRAMWDERGKGYYGEYMLFRELYPNLKGCCKILMNVEIPTPNGKTTEIDLLLIHETGIYVFEVKHYKGTIYGKENEPKWTQYFRTAANNSFRNPVLQNQYHIKALQNRYPGIPVRSFIVFTSSECDLRVECKEVTVCKLSMLHHYLQELETKEKIFDIDRIDVLFKDLLAFAPMMEQKVTAEGTEKEFYLYIDAIVRDQKELKRNLEETYRAKEKYEQRKSKTTIIVAAIICVASVLIAICIGLFSSAFAKEKVAEANRIANEQVMEANQALDAFAQKFEHVEKYNNGEIALADNFTTVSDVQMTQSVDVKEAVNLQFIVHWNGENYGAGISRDSKIVVLCKDGTVKEYDLLEETFPYTKFDLMLGERSHWYSAYKKWEFPAHELYGLSVEDISYIKLSNVNIWVEEDGGYDQIVVATGYEIEIYED